MVLRGRQEVALAVSGSLLVLLAVKAAFPLSSTIFIVHNAMWERMDQANLFTADAWGEGIGALFAAMMIRSFGARLFLLLAHLWQAYFAFFMLPLQHSFYEYWSNRFFSGLSSGRLSFPPSAYSAHRPDHKASSSLVCSTPSYTGSQPPNYPPI